MGLGCMGMSEFYGTRNDEQSIRDRRGRVVLATKFGNIRGADGSFKGISGKPDYVRKRFDN